MPLECGTGQGKGLAGRLLLPLQEPPLLGIAFAFGLPLAVAVTVTPLYLPFFGCPVFVVLVLAAGLAVPP